MDRLKWFRVGLYFVIVLAAMFEYKEFHLFILYISMILFCIYLVITDGDGE